MKIVSLPQALSVMYEIINAKGILVAKCTRDSAMCLFIKTTVNCF